MYHGDEVSCKNSVCKTIIETGETKLYTVGANEYCGGPIFIPKSEPTSDEDDGIVLVPVSCNEPTKPDFLTFLDSKTFEELGRVEFETVKFVQAISGIFTWDTYHQ